MSQRPAIELRAVTLYAAPIRTRFPFRYGITALTAVPHLFVEADVLIDGARAQGLSADNMAPKWFSKNPETSAEQDQQEMISVIRHAIQSGQEAGQQDDFFSWWQVVYQRQAEWAKEQGLPPLLAHWGVSLVERAVLDALCRHLALPLRQVLRENQIGFTPGRVLPELEGFSLAAVLPEQPLSRLKVRHTVGLGDALTDLEIPEDERLGDGLPQSLQACLDTYGVQALKIKVGGDPDADRVRLKRIATLAPAARFTLDGNEHFRSMGDFREQWEAWNADPELALWMQQLLFVEQPLHRDAALADEVGEALAQWPAHPPMIIDESDAAIGCLERALTLGYQGTSHKNCKGLMKGLLNACLLEQRRRTTGQSLVLSAEDLTNIGPVGLLQDLAMVATLGIPHVERNGHHYFKGLSMWPLDVQETMLNTHGDLFVQMEGGYPAVRISGGYIEAGSCTRAPFGVEPLLHPARFASKI